jgi:NADH dehydrogenase/NADH:ubiquinone oxidoreductase subunit G
MIRQRGKVRKMMLHEKKGEWKRKVNGKNEKINEES